jgi:hypothetical protein
MRLLMIGAMYENGGNTTQRFLDGHPEMFVYPFESQLGTRLVQDALTSVFPVKYRWPVFALDATSAQDYQAIIDEECKVRARTPNVSKFRDWPFEFSDDERRQRYEVRVAATGRSRSANIDAFFRATRDAWTNYHHQREPAVWVGYSPNAVVDAAKILADFPGGHVLHVVRNPWSAFADTKKRPVPLSVHDYMLGWTLNQYFAHLNRAQCPDRVHIVRIEDVMADPVDTLTPICRALGVEPAPSLQFPSWNGTQLEQVYPWGTIRVPSPSVNKATALELSAAEQDAVRQAAGPYLELLNYASFL